MKTLVKEKPVTTKEKKEDIIKAGTYRIIAPDGLAFSNHKGESKQKFTRRIASYYY